MFALVLASLVGLLAPSYFMTARLFLVNGILVAGVLWGWLLARKRTSSDEAAKSAKLTFTIAAIWFPLPVSALLNAYASALEINSIELTTGFQWCVWWGSVWLELFLALSYSLLYSAKFGSTLGKANGRRYIQASWICQAMIYGVMTILLCL